jgi:arabinofuranosyltransferase
MQRFAYAFLLTLFLTAMMSALVFALIDSPLTGIDDANIYFVYAKNLADGHGFVYNAGGERVEGFTSLLWTLVCALVFRITLYPELALLMVNVALVSLGIAVGLIYLGDHLQGGTVSPRIRFVYPAVFLILLLIAPRYILWNTITLMENALWSTLLFITTIVVIWNDLSPRVMLKSFIPLSIFLLLTRPEAVVWLVTFLSVLYIRLAGEGLRNTLTLLAPALVSFLLCFVLLTYFRIEYFGYPAPNTFYAKVSPSLAYNVQQGLGYLLRYTISDPIVFLSVIVTLFSGIEVIVRILRKGDLSDGSLFLPLLAGVGLLIPLLTGGDHFGSFRLYQSIYPIQLLALLCFAARRIAPLWQQGESARWNQTVVRYAAVFGLLLVAFELNSWNSVRSEVGIEFQVADYGRKNGAFIQSLFSGLPKLPSLGVVTSGGIKYSYEGEVVDLMGLNNTTMAHNQGDRKGIKNHAAFDILTFYQLSPDIVWPRTVVAVDWQYKYADVKESWENREGFKGLFDEPRFLDTYTYAKVSSSREQEYVLVGWFRKDFLKRLEFRPDLLVEKYPYSSVSGGSAAAHALILQPNSLPFS